MHPEEFDEICRSPCLEPVAAVSFSAECVEEAEWVVYPRGVRAEVVSVIVLLQLRAGLFVGLPVVQCEGPDVLVEVPEELGFAHAADVGIILPHGDVHKVVEVAEDADLAELGDPREECEADVSVH